jgi:hypothetical protein
MHPSPTPYASYAPSISPSLISSPEYIYCWVQIMKLIIMQSSPLPYYLVRLRPKYILQYSVLRHPQPTFLFHWRDQVSHWYKTTRKIICLYILIFISLEAREYKRFWTHFRPKDRVILCLLFIYLFIYLLDYFQCVSVCNRPHLCKVQEALISMKHNLQNTERTPSPWYSRSADYHYKQPQVT